MKKTVLIIAIYLLGCVCGYEYTKFNFTNQNRLWTKKDRIVCVLLSSLSWFTVSCNAIVHAYNTLDSDEKAEW